MSGVESSLEAVDGLIRSIVQNKMRVRLLPGDFRENTQRAWDCYQTILLELVEKLQAIESGEEAPIQNLAAYVKAVAQNTISDELRRGNKDRTRLKSRLRRFVSRQPSFALWAGSDEQFWCGFSGWAGLRTGLAPAARVASLAPRPVKPLDLMKPVDWRDVLDGIFTDLDGPVRLETLVAILVPWFGISSVETSIDDRDEDREEPAPEPPAPDPGPDRLERAREWLNWAWQAMAAFDRRWLIAFFLNLPMDNRTKERGEIEAFPFAGVASIAAIGERLSFSTDEYSILRREVANDALPDAGGLPSAELRFAALWRHLPLTDDQIGALLGLARQQVANLRMTMVAKLNKLWEESAAKPAVGSPPSPGGGKR